MTTPGYPIDSGLLVAELEVDVMRLTAENARLRAALRTQETQGDEVISHRPGLEAEVAE